MKVSSWVVNLHLRTPTSVLVGNGFDGFLSAICVFDFSSSLSMFGCGCDVNIEYELEQDHLELQDVVIAIPIA